MSETTATGRGRSMPDMALTFRDRLNGRALWMLCTLAARTSRITVANWETIDEWHAAGKSCLYGTWHGNSMMLVAFMRQTRPATLVSAIIPDDWRGAALFHWFNITGVLPWPMDLEGKGIHSARRFAGLVRLLKAGGLDSYISPDGPDGPSYAVKPGLGYLARKTGLPIIPVSACCRPGYTINRWDAYRIPLPFGHIHVSAGEPIIVGPDDNLEDVNETLRRAFNDVAHQARAEFYSGHYT